MWVFECPSKDPASTSSFSPYQTCVQSVFRRKLQSVGCVELDLVPSDQFDSRAQCHQQHSHFKAQVRKTAGMVIHAILHVEVAKGSYRHIHHKLKGGAWFISSYVFISHQLISRNKGIWLFILCPHCLSHVDLTWPHISRKRKACFKDIMCDRFAVSLNQVIRNKKLLLFQESDQKRFVPQQIPPHFQRTGDFWLHFNTQAWKRKCVWSLSSWKDEQLAIHTECTKVSAARLCRLFSTEWNLPNVASIGQESRKKIAAVYIIFKLHWSKWKSFH